jgi:cell division protein FtsZ
MNLMNTPPPSTPDTPTQTVSLKIFGVGTAGMKVLDQLAARCLPGAACVAIGASTDSLAASTASEKICLQSESCGGFRQKAAGLIGGGLPDAAPPSGAAASEQPAPASPSPGEQGGRVEPETDVRAAELRAACEGAEVVFILAGLGGDTGTELAPLLARAARQAGALTLAFVTLPFAFEGNRRRDLAQDGLARLKTEADGVLCLPNEKFFKRVDDRTSVLDMFKLMNEVLAESVGSLWRMLGRKGLIEIRWTDLCEMLRGCPDESCFATAEATGPARAREAVEKLFAHPLLDSAKALAEADVVLVGILGGPDLTMQEVNRIMESINAKCRRAQVMMGATIDDSLRERLALTVIAGRDDDSSPAQAGMDEAGQAEATRPAEGLENQLLNRAETPRPHSRFVPPPPSLPPEQVERLMARQGNRSARARKGSPRMRQGQLPLEIVSKGRFDKSEPTIHKGEDLDVPTYIRRGVALN